MMIEGSGSGSIPLTSGSGSAGRDTVYLNYLMEENVDGLPVLGLLVHGLLAQTQQARARQRQELLHQSSLLFSVADPDPG
jgi:hypothetical protein